MHALRNIAIIMLLALFVAAIPGGGNLAQALLAVVTVSFLAAIGGIGYLVYRQQQFAYMTLTDRQRLIFVGSVGAILLVLAGAEELAETGVGVLALIIVLAAAVLGIIRVVGEARSI